MVRQLQYIALAGLLILMTVFVFFKSSLMAPDTGGALAASEGVTIRAQAVPLNEEDPTQRQVGALTYVGGWALTADMKQFGGFSGMVLSLDGDLTAINDAGTWLTMQLDPTALGKGSLVIRDAALHPYSQTMATSSKFDLDAEALLRFDDRFLVSFEQQHRVRIALPGQEDDAAWRPVDQLPLGQLSDNGGMEAIAFTRDGRFFTVAERGKDTEDKLPAWLVSEEGVEALWLKPPSGYAPTDAALLPDGDLLLTLRRYTVVDGVSVKIIRIREEELAAGAILTGEELAHLAPPLTVDNLEALDVMAMPDGSVRLFIMSDDNFSSRQRTLLLAFSLRP